MSYNRTVTCSHCWNSGHNKAGCSVLRERMQERLADDSNDWRAKQYFEDKERSKKRSCSYCKEEGHTKRTCVHIKADKEKTVQMNKEWRVKALDYLKNLGLGVGALAQLTLKRSWGEDTITNVMISEVLWDNLTFTVKNGSNPYSFVVRNLENFSQTRMADFPVDPTGIVSPSNEHGLYIKVLGPVSASSIEADVPDFWLSGDGDVIDNMFLDSRGKARERYYTDWIEK